MTEWTAKFTMHMRLQGGHKYAHDILADGKPTGICCLEETRRHKKIAKILSKGDDQYDMLADDHTKERMYAWLEGHK